MSSTDHLRSRLGNRYVIERELGRGGMGAVYLARDIRLDRPVALKVLPSEFAVLPALRERFLRETRTAASFSHPNIVPVYAVEEADDLLAYAMAYVEGESLADRVKRAGPLPVREVVRLLQDTGYALAYAHGRGVVHRDIKPDNIMIERATGRALIMDFGIARVIAAPAAPGVEGLTRVGEVVGTPEYMSPEQATGDHVDGRSDLYSLGLTAFFALAGHPAITGDTTGRILARQITEQIPSARSVRADIPQALAEAIDRCVEKDPVARFANAEGLVEALDLAQLAAPEIPLPVRLFAQEAGTLSLILIGAGMIELFMIRLADEPGGEHGDLALPVMLLFSVLITRILQTFHEARRLATQGFTPDEVTRGMGAVLAERASRRSELRADPATHRARRRTFEWGIAQLVIGLIAFRIALLFRHQTGPHSYQVEPTGGLLVLLAMVMLGVSLAQLLRSPFRATLGERLFRMVWLGPIGRAFVRLAARRVPKREEGRLVTAPSAAAVSHAPVTPHVPSSNGTSQLDNLERRVQNLEHWQRSVSPKP
jgi:serine/threonine-protein kinase